MSTRCMIQLGKSGLNLYRHCDGYPDGVGGVPETMRRTIESGPIPGLSNDPEYAAASIVHRHMQQICPKRNTNLGIALTADGIHGDEDYLYLLTDKGGEWWLYVRGNDGTFPTEQNHDEAFNLGKVNDA